MFAGARFEIRDQTGLRGGKLGDCNYTDKILRIPIEGDTLGDLDCIIHEGVHASCPWMTEDTVDAVAMSIARLLWRLGWRNESET